MAFLRFSEHKIKSGFNSLLIRELYKNSDQYCIEWTNANKVHFLNEFHYLFCQKLEIKRKLMLCLNAYQNHCLRESNALYIQT